MTSTRVSRVATLAPILRGAGRGLQRFPLTVVAGAAAATSGILLIEEIGNQPLVERLFATAILGISLFIGLRLLAEGRRWRGAAGWIPDALGVVALASFFLAWPAWSETVRITRTLQLAAVFHLFVAVAPFVAGRAGGFWEYNRELFERAVLAALYALVLWVGTALAVLALDRLFGVDIAGTAYGRLWFLAAFLFSSWFFVSALPEDFERLEQVEDYPRGLRAFTRFALLPIVAVYLLILTAYFVKVLVTWQWPSGWIGWLVSVVAVAGIFSLLLVHPLSARPGDRWVGTYARGFYLLLLPAVVMLWLAIGQRVGQYGITERRYFLIVLSVWLAGVAVYQLVTRARGIRVIPATLCLGGLLTFAGPWGAYAVSERSQVGRLEGLLQRHGMLAEGRAVAATEDVPVEDRREITAILEYLGTTHGYGAIAGWFPDSLWATGDAGGERDARTDASVDVTRLMAVLGIRPAERLPGETGPFRFAVRPGHAALSIEGYAVLVPVQGWVVGTPPDAGWWARGNEADLTFTMVQDGQTAAVFELGPLLDALRASTGPARDFVPDQLMVRSTGPRDGRLYLRYVGGRVDDGRVVITDLAGEVVLAAAPDVP